MSFTPPGTPNYRKALRRVQAAARDKSSDLNLFGLGLTTGALPEELFALRHLEKLNLSENELTSLPPRIRELTNLKWLGLSHNPISWPPTEVISQGGERTAEFVLRAPWGASAPPPLPARDRTESPDDRRIVHDASGGFPRVPSRSALVEDRDHERSFGSPSPSPTIPRRPPGGGDRERDRDRDSVESDRDNAYSGAGPGGYRNRDGHMRGVGPGPPPGPGDDYGPPPRSVSASPPGVNRPPLPPIGSPVDPGPAPPASSRPRALLLLVTVDDSFARRCSVTCASYAELFGALRRKFGLPPDAVVLYFDEDFKQEVRLESLDQLVADKIRLTVVTRGDVRPAGRPAYE